ncbi:hypothetical protein [Lewinella sp. W8]|uniref:hypothetical protein n=1 Tax=Lewinella sp. W8 TaxID=2528208 RepID=UPI0010680B97|nr:hypothetical protein [Lewinella sp. W8]MTB50615.1 hypothetical protein [Lewinella sp. W8]
MALRTLICLIVLLLPAIAAADCGPYFGFYGYQFLNPKVVDYDSRLAPFFLAFGDTYEGEAVSAAAVQLEDNLAEWHERYCEQVDLLDIQNLIYGNTENRLQRLLRLIGQPQARTADLPPNLRANSFAQHLLRHKCDEVVEYLLFAKRCEPLVSSDALAFTTDNTRREDMERLIDDGLDRFKTLKSHYVRLRYAFQIIRLAHYLKEYDYVIELYNYLMPKIEAEESIIYDWIEGHRAGALQAKGEYAQSAYLFSRVFERCPSKRESAYLSFRIRTDQQWKDALLLCESDHERAMMHVLRAQNSKAQLVEEMRSIYRYDPQNAALTPLLMRELLELERDLLGLDFNPYRQRNEQAFGRPRRGVTSRVVALQEFINEVIRDGKSGNKDFWMFARGVVELLAGDYFYAEETFEDLRVMTENDSIVKQLDILDEVLHVLALNRISDSIEVYYYQLLRQNSLRRQYPDLRSLVNDKLEAVYRQKGATGKAALLQYGFDALRINPQLPQIQELESMADSILGNSFDRLLLAERVGPNAEDDINDLLGTYYLQQGQWETALEIFRRVPTARRDTYGTYAPFVKQFNDRVNFRPSATATEYNKVDLLERLLELEEEARGTTNDTLAARNYFNIGLALYNMSYFSYNWRMADYFRSGSSMQQLQRSRRNGNFVFSHPEAPLGNREDMNMERARYYFERALTRAPNREAAAEAVFFAAKTERNQHYTTAPPGATRPFRYFQLLRTNYAGTRFYQKAIAECRTFAWYVDQ